MAPFDSAALGSIGWIFFTGRKSGIISHNRIVIRLITVKWNQRRIRLFPVMHHQIDLISIDNIGIKCESLIHILLLVL